MRVVLTERFSTRYIEAPPDIQKVFGKQLAYLLRNLRIAAGQEIRRGPRDLASAGQRRLAFLFRDRG